MRSDSKKSFASYDGNNPENEAIKQRKMKKITGLTLTRQSLATIASIILLSQH